MCYIEDGAKSYYVVVLCFRVLGRVLHPVLCFRYRVMFWCIVLCFTPRVVFFISCVIIGLDQPIIP